MAPQRIRVAVADDQPLFLRGAVGALEEDPAFEVVSQTTSDSSALKAIVDLEPDVAVLDGGVPDARYTHLLRELARSDVRTQILVLTPSGDAEAIRSAVASGVAGYLTRNADEPELRGAVTLVARGDTVIADELRLSLVEAVEPTLDSKPNPLSPQERRVLKRIAAGRSARQIADELYVSESTVKTCLSRIYAKLGVCNGAAAVAEAMRRNLIGEESDPDYAASNTAEPALRVRATAPSAPSPAPASPAAPPAAAARVRRSRRPSRPRCA